MNDSERVITLDDGRQFCDPWVLFDNWTEKNGLSAMMDEAPCDVVRWYDEYGKAESLTGDLFAAEAAT